MALFQPILGNLSGSIGANTFSHNKGGPYTRRRAKPVNNTSTRRTVVRGYLSANARAWGGLTESQRTAWRNYAAANPVLNRQGVSTNVSGLAMYNRLNQRISDIGGTTLLVPPGSAGPAGLITLTITNPTATTVSLAFTATPLPAGARIALWWTGARSAGVDPNFNQARLIAYSAAAVATPAVFTLPATVTPGLVGNFYACVVDAAGRTSPPRKFRLLFV